MPKKVTAKDNKSRKLTVNKKSGKAENKKSENKKNNNNNQAQKQVYALITFAVALFLLAVVLIEGGSAWKFLHDSLFGLFGICTYVLPVIIGAISIITAFDKFKGNLKNKIIESCVLVILIDAAIDIFVMTSLPTFAEHINYAWASGAELKSGGFFGA